MKIVIIGGGVAGLGIGWRLVQAGADVTLLERTQPASGASWAAAGMIAITAELANSGPDEAVFANYSNGLWPDFAAELEQASGLGIGYSRSGALILAPDAVTLTAMRTRTGPDLKLLDPAEARAMAPMLTGEFAGALWAEHEAHVDNRALGHALAIAFQRAGGKLQSNEAVVRIERRNGKAAIAHTPFGLYHADAFVIAAGAWSGLIEPELAPITPVKGEMIALAPPDGASPPGPCIWADGVYAVPRGRLLLLGATVEEAGFDTALTHAAATQLRAGAEAAMPGLKEWTQVDHWAGLRPRSPDGLPLLGPTAVEGLFVAGGQYRNGILFTPAIARMMADLILGQGKAVAAFDPQTFHGKFAMSDFVVDPVIASLTHHLDDWPLCRVFLYDDSRYAWGLLVPRRAGAIEIRDLGAGDQAQLMAEIVRLSNIVRILPGVEKLNVGSLGNMVPQLHVHVVGRYKGDPAWPGPVWGHSAPVPYPDPALAPLAALVKKT